MHTVHLDAQHPHLRGQRILVVEDEALVGMLVEEELLDAGAEVIGPAFSLNEALWLLEMAAGEGGLSAAVLDIDLAGQAVWPVADRLAALGIPFVFSTGRGEHGPSSPHAEAPRLIKPFDLDALVAAVELLTLSGAAGRRSLIDPADQAFPGAGGLPPGRPGGGPASPVWHVPLR